MASALNNVKTSKEAALFGFYHCSKCNKFWRSEIIQDPITLEFKDKQKCRRCHNLYKTYKKEIVKCQSLGLMTEEYQGKTTVDVSSTNSSGNPVSQQRDANMSLWKRDGNHWSQHPSKTFIQSTQLTKISVLKKNRIPTAFNILTKRNTGGMLPIPKIQAVPQKTTGAVITVNNVSDNEDDESDDNIMCDDEKEGVHDDSEESEEDLEFIEEDDLDIY